MSKLKWTLCSAMVAFALVGCEKKEEPPVVPTPKPAATSDSMPKVDMDKAKEDAKTAVDEGAKKADEAPKALDDATK